MIYKPRTVCYYPNTMTYTKQSVINCVQYPSKQKTFVLHLHTAGPTSKTLGRRCTNVTQNVLCLLG